MSIFKGKLLGNIPDEPVIDPNRIEGKIIHLDDGWGFISSPVIKYTRIFFHWTGLEQDTLHFTELKKGMKVSFLAKEYEERGWRAFKIFVLEDDDDNNEEEEI